MYIYYHPMISPTTGCLILIVFHIYSNHLSLVLQFLLLLHCRKPNDLRVSVRLGHRRRLDLSQPLCPCGPRGGHCHSPHSDVRWRRTIRESHHCLITSPSAVAQIIPLPPPGEGGSNHSPPSRYCPQGVSLVVSAFRASSWGPAPSFTRLVSRSMFTVG